jgi:hypothetical protein
MRRNGMVLSRDAILATSIPDETVDVPEWDGKIRLRGLSAAERDAYEQGLMEQNAKGEYRTRRDLSNIRASFLVKCIIDEAGERVFNDSDASALGEKSAAVIDRLWDRARALSGMAVGEEAVEAFGRAQGENSDTD